MEHIALYPGSFDPVTVGHMDLIERAAAMFDEVVVGVLVNPLKQGTFSPEERVALLEKCCNHLPNVRVTHFDGMTVELCRREGACCMIRGLRAMDDYIAEERLAQLNHRIAPEIDTVFLPSREEDRCISSSAVRELAQFGGSLKGYVPEAVLQTVTERLEKTRRNAR